MQKSVLVIFWKKDGRNNAAVMYSSDSPDFEAQDTYAVQTLFSEDIRTGYFPETCTRIRNSHAANISLGSALCVDISFSWALHSAKVAHFRWSTGCILMKTVNDLLHILVRCITASNQLNCKRSEMLTVSLTNFISLPKPTFARESSMYF